jgi:hypothetical protein
MLRRSKPSSGDSWGIYCRDWGVFDYSRSMDWWMDLLTTCIYNSELRFTDHWHTQISVLSLLQSPLAVSRQRLLPVTIIQLPALWSSCHSRPCRTLVNWQLNWLGSRLEAISHQPPSLLFTGWLSAELTTELSHSPTSYFTSLHPTRLTLLITFRYETHRKRRSHCYNPTIPRPLHAYSLPRVPVYLAVAYR